MGIESPIDNRLSTPQIGAMNSSVAIHLRVPLAQARLLKRAARLDAEKLATWVRRIAVAAAEQSIQQHEAIDLQIQDAKEAGLGL